MTIATWLKNAANTLADNLFESPRLDAEIILAHTTGHPRSWLHAHGDETLDLRQQEIADARLDLRLDRVPIAYIIGHKEFYGRRFNVTTQTLIPRPESEIIIELLKTHVAPSALRLVDIGTGSGCLGVTAKLELPKLSVSLIDTSRPALAVARKNADRLGADIDTLESDLLEKYPYTPDVVLANLPYVDQSWQRSKDTDHEPSEALFAEGNGLEIIYRCLDQLSSRMNAGGVAIFEADPRQFDAIVARAQTVGFYSLETNGFGLAFQKR